MAERVPPHNLEAEESVLGAMIIRGSNVPPMVAQLSPSDFYRPSHATIFTVIAYLYDNGFSINEITMANELQKRGALEDVGGLSVFANLMANTPDSGSNSVRNYATIIRGHAAQRRIIGAASEAATAAYNFVDPGEIADELSSALSTLDRGGSLPDRYWPSTSAYLVADKGESSSPVIDGMVPGRSRTIVLATEKAGKSTLLRQSVMLAAAGLHPFTFKPIEPVRSLILDAENDDDELDRSIGMIEELLTKRLGPDFPRAAILSAPYGMDLRSRRDRAELEEVLEDCRPQLIVGGPIYKLTARREREGEDDRSGALQTVLNDIRRRFGCALIIEHHAPTGPAGMRELRSKGGQQWDAWTNATIALYASSSGQSVSVKYVHPPRGRIRWPKAFERANQPNQWPWNPVWDAIPRSEMEVVIEDRVAASHEAAEYEERIF